MSHIQDDPHKLTSNRKLLSVLKGSQCLKLKPCYSYSTGYDNI